MKKLVLILVSLASFSSFSQMAVTDVGASAQLAATNSTLASTLSTASAQLTQLEKNYEQIMKASEKVEKVNKAIKSVEKIEDFIKMQKEIIANIKAMTNLKSKHLNPTKMTMVLNTTSSIISNVQKILSDGFFNLNDKERVDLLKEERHQLEINLVRSRLMLKAAQ